MGKIVLDGELIASTLPHLEEPASSTLIPQTPKEAGSTKELQATQKTPTSGVRGKRVDVIGKSSRVKTAICRPTSSSIPLPILKNVKSSLPTKISPSHNTVRMGSIKLSKQNSGVQKTAAPGLNKHTLELQFMTKKKKFTQLHKDLIDKQKPVLDLYQSLVQIKKKLEELGKVVVLEELQLLPLDAKPKLPAKEIAETPEGAGDKIPPEIVTGMQNSIEEIPKTLMEICKNLLARRNLIVELLESVVKSEVNISDLSEQIETLKLEGTQLQSNLDCVINEHHNKIKEIVKNWHVLLNDKKSLNSNIKVDDLEDKLKIQEQLYAESKQVVEDLHKKLDDKRNGHDRYVAELNNVISGLKDQIQKLEQDLESEKKNATEFKMRNSSNAQASKSLRGRITDLESEKKIVETHNTDLTKKVRLLQDQMKHKESQWHKEKEEITKNMKHQQNMIDKFAAEKNSFETRLTGSIEEKTNIEDSCKARIDDLERKVDELNDELFDVTKQRDEAQDRCKEISEHISGLGREERETMHNVTKSINWGGKGGADDTSKADVYSENMMKDIIIQEYRDTIKQLEEENNIQKSTIALMETNVKCKSDREKKVIIQHDLVVKYKQLLADSEQKLTEKSQEVAKLTSEIRQLKVRQEHLEELNQKCPTENLQKMVEEGRNKLSELMRKSMESEQKILHCENIIDKQSKQMNEMENLLRYRENMAGVLKAARDELIIEKESLTRYSHEMRMVLAEVTKEGKMKDRLIKELQEKIDLRERQISKMEKEIRDLENNLVMTNDKRFKLQETIGSMEKELQCTKAHVNQLADLNTRYEFNTKLGNTISSSSINTLNINLDNQSGRHTISDLKDLHKHRPHVYSGSKSKEVNCRSLIGLSLQQVDYLKSRLNYLTQLNTSESPVPLTSKSLKDLKLQPPKYTFTLASEQVTNVPSTKDVAEYCGRHKNLAKIMELTAKRYEYLQKQAYESYEELTNLVKMALSSHSMRAV